MLETSNHVESFSIFNRDTYPKINVTFNNNKINDANFKEFLDNWDDCDRGEQRYSFFFDLTQGLNTTPPIKYAFSISKFIKKKKKTKESKLNYSIILVKNKSLILLLRIIFNLTSPIAPVYITTNENIVNELYNIIDSNQLIPKEYKVITFKP